MKNLSRDAKLATGILIKLVLVTALQYNVDEQVLADFIPPKDVSILFMLEPLFPTDSEMQALDDWVEAGGTLIVIGEQYGMYSLIDHYQFTLNYLSDQSGVPANQTPLFASPAAPDLKNAKVRFSLASDRDDFVVLVAHRGEPVLVSFEQGKGRVILGTTTESFTNAGLKNAGNPE